MAHNPIVDLAAKSLQDLETAHFQDGLDMATAMTDYAHAGSDAAAKKNAGLALVTKLQGEGHISAWAAGNFRAYFNLTPQELQANGIAQTPSIPTPGQTVNDIGKAAENAAGSVTNDVLKPLFQANLWLRVGQVALGLILIAVGVAKMTGAVPLATKIAGVVK